MKKITLCLMMSVFLVSGCATTPTSTNNATNKVPTANRTSTTTMYRTVTERLNDEIIERTSHKNLSGIAGVDEKSVRIAIDSFRQEVLLTGEVPSEQVQAEVEKMVNAVHGVKAVYNNLVVTTSPKSQSYTLHENYLKSRILTKLVSTGKIKPSQYKIVVRSSMAYVIAFLTGEQEQAVLQSIESVQGIEGVRMFGVRMDNNPSLLAKADNSIADEMDTGGVMYGGQAVEQGTAPFAITPMPTTNSPTNTPNKPKSAPIVRMDGKPNSSYVNLYNNTSKP